MVVPHNSLSTSAVMGYRVDKTDISGSIALGGTAQDIAVENANRRGFSIMNVSDTDMWINTEGVATADSPSLKLEPGAYYEEPSWGVSIGAISVFCGVTGKKFTAREW